MLGMSDGAGVLSASSGGGEPRLFLISLAPLVIGGLFALDIGGFATNIYRENAGFTPGSKASSCWA
jgi:hypothetical protein